MNVILPSLVNPPSPPPPQVLLPPVYVNLMYCAIPLCLSSAAFVAQRQSRLMGRVQTMVLNRGLGITLLAWIASHPNVRPRWRRERREVAAAVQLVAAAVARAVAGAAVAGAIAGAVGGTGGLWEGCEARPRADGDALVRMRFGMRPQAAILTREACQACCCQPSIAEC